MSEYQYYEFQAVDQPLDERQQEELRGISTRACITATRFVNHYEWGDLKAAPLRLIKRYFDLFLYVANWGTRRFAMRLPKRLVAAGDLKRFHLDGETARAHATGHHLIVDVFVEEVESEDWDDGSGWLAALAPLRADVINGDMRLFYIVWLTAVANGQIADEAVEPLCGIAPLSGSLRAFADFLGIDVDLLGVAAGNVPGGYPAGSARTAGELRAAAARLAEAHRRIRAAKAAANRRRQEKERAQARKRYLADLAKRENAAWHEVENLIQLRNGASYDAATALLADLRNIARSDRRAEAFARRIADIRVRHEKKGRFVERLEAAGLCRRPRLI